jgi:predicted DNA-binding protein YlxM (UPF0122 family)
METKDFTRIADLIDLYGALLTEKQRDIMVARFHQDFSLSEISENTQISRSAVQDTIKKTTEKLRTIEESVGFLQQKMHLAQAIQQLEESSLSETQKAIIQKMKEAL